MKISQTLSSIIALIITFTFPLNSFAQQAQPYTYAPKLTEELNQLKLAAMTSDYAYRQTAYLCNNIGARLSGSPQAARAVEYVADEMRKQGFAVQLEKCKVPHWVRGAETGELIEFNGQAPSTTQKIVLTALGGSVATPAEGLTAEVIVVDDYAALNALGRDKVAGKIVLFNAKFDMRMAMQGEGGSAYGQAVAYRGGGASAAARLGAVAALNRSAGGGIRLPHTGGVRYDDNLAKIPAAAVTAEDAELMAYLVKQGKVRMRLTLTPQTFPDVESYNVIADLKGSEHPEQVVIVSGHLDSWDLGTGAHDDAVGVAAAMATAYLIKQLGLKPRRTIRVIAWMSEEPGLQGASAYATTHQADVANHIAAIEIDLGAGHPLGILGHASNRAMAMLQPLSGILQSIGAPIVRQTPGSPSSDITMLDFLGVPTFAPFQDSRFYFNYHHTPADTLDKVNPQELAENTAVMAVLAYAIASLPEVLPRQ
ncbi:MAG: M20/M25/M40 family metallo-hydrolase [Acidobacteriota bacterium]